MSNPVISRNPYFTGRTQQGAPTSPGYAPRGSEDPTNNSYGQQSGYASQYQPFDTQYGQPQASQQYGYQAQPQSAFTTPSLTTMTYEDAMVKTVMLLGITLLAGIATVYLVPVSMLMPIAWATIIGSFVLSIVIAFQRMVNPGVAIAYAALEGVALGAISFAFEYQYPGIVFQAVLGTIIVVAVAAALHFSGKVRTTPKGTKIVMVVMVSYLIFSLVNLGIMHFSRYAGMWGLRSSIEIAGIPLGVILGLLMIAVAGYVLIGDLESVKFAVDNGAPKQFSWTCGIAILMTVLWIYMEILRVLAILREN